MRPTIAWENGALVMIDQRKLPAEETYIECRTVEGVAEAIESMVIRGAPAIGVAAAYGLVLGLDPGEDEAVLDESFERAFRRLEGTRPTARNLFWALERMRAAFWRHRRLGGPGLKHKLFAEARAIEKEDIETNRRIGDWGKSLIDSGKTVLTHCNAGALATAGFGTALGVIAAAHEEGKEIRVFADETRPFLQGARLTCWELSRAGIPVTLITDGMAGHFMQRGEISLVITGADRIARNGDAANKIGTYPLAVLAREHGIPFYIAAPLSSFDFDLPDGSRIPIEERSAREVREVGGCLITLPDIPVKNPAFDVTPARFISAIITEKGIARPPYERSLAMLPGKE